MLTVCVWGADGLARRAHHAALSAALETSRFDAQLGHGLHADLHFLLGVETSPGDNLRAADALLRQQLGTAGTPYSVLYGTAASQVAKALAAIDRRLQPDVSPSRDPLLNTPVWVWPCDKCGDAGCEYKLLSGLLSQRVPAS